MYGRKLRTFLVMYLLITFATGIVIRPGKRSLHILQKRSLGFHGPSVREDGHLENTNTMKREYWHKGRQFMQRKALEKRNEVLQKSTYGINQRYQTKK